MTAGTRLQWLRRQPKNFRPQPYQQLAHVFEQAGLQGDATTVRVASEEEAYESDEDEYADEELEDEQEVDEDEGEAEEEPEPQRPARRRSRRTAA